MKSMAELWARGVNEKTKVKPETAPIKPVVDNNTESLKSKFRQSLLNKNNKKEMING